MLFYALVGGTAATRIAGFIVAKAVRRALDTTVVVQASVLLATTIDLVVMHLCLPVHPQPTPRPLAQPGGDRRNVLPFVQQGRLMFHPLARDRTNVRSLTMTIANCI